MVKWRVDVFKWVIWKLRDSNTLKSKCNLEDNSKTSYELVSTYDICPLLIENANYTPTSLQKKKKKNYTPTYTQNTTGKKNELKFEIIVGKFYFIFGRKESTLLNRN